MELETFRSGKPFKLHDIETAFRSKSDSELHTARFVFGAVRFKLISFFLIKLVKLALFLKLPIKGILRNTLFKVFIAGETIDEAKTKMQTMESYGVDTVLDYVAEAGESESDYLKNLQTIQDNIAALKGMKGRHCISLKLSGIMNTAFMESVNYRLRSLSDEENKAMQELVDRVDSICKLACENDIQVFIDAETYATQFLYDWIAELMMQRYNTKKVYVYNTLQMYLNDRLVYLDGLVRRARVKEFHPGIKLVRGAYVEYERENAQKKGYTSPVFNRKQETDDAFNGAVRYCLNRDQPLHTCIASHNAESVELAMKLMQDKMGYRDRLSFSQLYGMSDTLTFNLAAAGMHASKYLPYGEIEKAVPYMLRRAEENTSIGQQMGRELEMVTKECKRRKEVKQF